MTKNHKQGYVILIAVIIVGAITLLISIGAMTRTVGGVLIDIDKHSAMNNKLLAESCAEVALINIQRVLQYQGNEDIIVGISDCHIKQVEKGVDELTIRTIAESEKYEWGIEVTTRGVVQEVLVDRWRDVTDN